ncbi:MAG: excinuclease ABC subunit UvrB [Candidatus Cardinium sp.]|nr:excinuclease ABC subunit UvrB [Candidatus Cardinium sp.]
MLFELIAPYEPAGDQPKAILDLVKNSKRGILNQVLLGVTGSGKTFTIANTIKELNKPTLVISHNKTLAAQLYGEFQAFFPNNRVEYFVSYYDYYQPEVYLPVSNIYIEKELAINDELERLRLSTVSSLLSGRKDIIVVASVSCIYGIGKPETFQANSCLLKIGALLPRHDFLNVLVGMLYRRHNQDTPFTRGCFRVLGDTIDLFVAYADYAYRLVFWEDELEAIFMIEPTSGRQIKAEREVVIFPANLFMTNKETLQEAIQQIQLDLAAQLTYLEQAGKLDEAKRLQERTLLDLEMLKELGYCSGIENYSRYMDGRIAGERPYCLLDYFPSDYLMVIDESHVTMPQFRAMWGGDRARKINLVEHGFRLPAAMDNRPLHFNEFESLLHQVIFVSATPADYELERSNGIIVEQIIRPTGLVDPQVDVRPTTHQMHDILNAIHAVVAKGERVLITTLTKRMAEKLTDYLVSAHIRCKYMHSEIKTLDRVTILNELRKGTFDVLVGVNLLREGLDLPQASLMLILDADKEGFLRNTRSLIQTIGRVARHTEGYVIMYADSLTASMEKAIQETERRRKLQIAYNTKHHITPSSVYQKQIDIEFAIQINIPKKYEITPHETPLTIAEDTAAVYNSKDSLQAKIKKLEGQMHQAAAALRFLEADRLKACIERLKKDMR